MENNQTLRLINYLNRGGSFGYYWLKLPPEHEGQESGPKRTIWFKTGEPATWPEGSYDLYFGVHPSKQIPKRISKKTNRPISPHLVRTNLEDIAAVNCLFAEFDAKHFPGKKDEALDHIKSILQPPSVLIDSGGGYHAYWLLIEPLAINDQFTLKRLRSYQARWVEYVGGDPDSKDLCRVLRVPGSYNYKYDPPREVSILFADWDMPYEITDLIKWLPPERANESIVNHPSPNHASNIQRDPCAHWLDKALSRLIPGDERQGRNGTGYWLAQQLIWDGVGQTDQERVMLEYASRVRNQGSHEYTDEEALKSLESARKLPPREPARGRATAIRPIIVTHRPAGNGSASHSGNGKSVTDQATAAPVPSQNGDNHKADPVTGEGISVTNTMSSTVENDDGGLQTWQLVYLDFERIREGYENQEAGDGDLLSTMYRDRICYDHAESAWYIWKKHFWERDLTGFTYRLVARRVSPQYLHAAGEAQAKDMEDLSKNLAKRAAALRNKKRMDNVLFLAARNEHLALKGDEWDSDPWLLGCANGVIELKTGKFRPGNPKDYIRAHSKVEWTGLDTPCPRWERFLQEIFSDKEISDFMQRLFGYGITGLTVHHLFPILWGANGRNGKGTMLETLGNVLGSDLAISSQADALMDMNKSGEGPKPFIFNLRGKRLVWASESNEGRRINEGLVKQLTGGDRLNVRTLHSKPVEFLPSHLLLLITNYKPHINADGGAIWRRVFLIPFEQEFIDNPDPNKSNQHKADPYLIETLKQEQSGILAWLVRGCLKWQKEGLNPPEKIMAATQAYRDEEDTTGIFISEKCILKETSETKAGQLYRAYSDWCKENSITPMSLTSFGKLMRNRFPARESHGIVYTGIGLLA